MNKTRRDAWTKNEDILLAETVLRYIRSGKTQLDAFKHVGETLARTPAACGFRWNAAVRKQYDEAIQMAKKSRKSDVIQDENVTEHYLKGQSIETAISLLEKVRDNVGQTINEVHWNEENYINELKDNNALLKQKIVRMEEAWVEMEKLWKWAINKE